MKACKNMDFCFLYGVNWCGRVQVTEVDSILGIITTDTSESTKCDAIKSGNENDGKNMFVDDYASEKIGAYAVRSYLDSSTIIFTDSFQGDYLSNKFVIYDSVRANSLYNAWISTDFGSAQSEER